MPCKSTNFIDSRLNKKVALDLNANHESIGAILSQLIGDAEKSILVSETFYNLLDHHSLNWLDKSKDHNGEYLGGYKNLVYMADYRSRVLSASICEDLYIVNRLNAFEIVESRIHEIEYYKNVIGYYIK
ncbi:hypothetical protein RF11_00292 [Thelohanellus kitauei]|uniref:Uncharacterized protein n=1 Tax=Thelohanellus kitauei TaxID=669202 RepID=A0A0C2MN32_THEKT|nr:hypothetical protein RF11_00292 [Thelohanellus kitauei]